MQGTKSKDVEVLVASQFFEVRDMSWAQLKRIVESAGGSPFTQYGMLWLRKVRPEETPLKGDVWYREGQNGKPEVYKANYDSSD